MKYLLYMMVFISAMSSQTIFDFTTKSDIQDWIVVDDVVMGGKSSGTFKLNADGYGVSKVVYHWKTMEDSPLCAIDSEN